MVKKYLYALLVCVACGGVVVGVMRKKRKDAAAEQCKDRKSCVGRNDCQCYCSYECGFRDKTSEDRPVVVENDPNGKYCYCKQWDLDNYEINCSGK